ncbi:MraY family glycosyltransferase [Brumimicrobium salinarum]|uniref:MraY family glycosyltransferase n=1 Tax=Brumimicrobium salinarum TaxID=2058658 RepID=UPI0013FE435F|nr:MraY family glycosyltransferase [Brumimicrobium salinarum]
MQFNFLFEYITFFIAALIISLIINKLILRFAKNLGIRNKNDVTVRWSNASKPSLGGISLYFTFIISVLIYASVSSTENIFNQIEFIGLIAAATLAFGIGVADDAYNTKPLLKLIGQISCGLIFVFSNNTVDVFHQPIIDGLITVIWVVAVMNSLNMLDNMDGITGTVSFFILTTCFVVLAMINDPNNLLWMFLIIAEVGALLGFLMYNIHPAKMFMGDTGSQFIALFISFFGIKALWNLPAIYEVPSWTSLFLVLTAFTPTVADTLTVVINRRKRGDSIMLGGKDHTTHHLVYRGFSDFKVWLIFLLISIFSFGYAICLSYFLIIGKYWIAFFGLLFFLVIFIPLYRNTLKYHPPKG